MPDCQVCGSREAGVGIASSPLGPFSVCYGQRCLDEGAEPIWAVETLLDINGGIEGCNEWFLDSVKVFYDNAYITVRDFSKTKI